MPGPEAALPEEDLDDEETVDWQSGTQTRSSRGSGNQNENLLGICELRQYSVRCYQLPRTLNCSYN